MKLLWCLVMLPFSLSAQDKTAVAFTMQDKVTGENNVVYCASMELLWLHLIDYLGEQPLIGEQNHELYRLNKAVADYQIPLEDNYWFTKIGTIGGGINDSIRQQYKKQFEIDWIPGNYTADKLIGHAFLKKNIDFYSRLGHDFNDFKFNDSIKVDCFGLKGGWANPVYKKQLKIHDYVDNNNFIFQVGCKDSLDEIYFAKIPPGKTLLETYEAVKKRIDKNAVQYMGLHDELRIPYLKFDITEKVNDLQGVAFSGYSALEIEELSQKISFDLTKEGVRLESSGMVTVTFGISEQQPVVYSFNRPFLIMLKRKDATAPYFLYWVQSTEHMTIK